MRIITQTALVLITLSMGVLCPITGLSQFGRNYRPAIIGQQPLSVYQGQPITIELSHLYVIDLNDPYPQGFTLRVFNGKNYDREGTTVTPDDDFTGILTVEVTVDDGREESRRFDLKITVLESPNVAPIIDGQVSLSMVQGESMNIQLSHLTVNDPDNDYPDDFSLIVSNGQNYSVSGDRVTPSSSFVGTLTVTVRVNDGEDNSDPYGLKITVKPKNVPPTITGQSSLSVTQGNSLTIQLSHLTVTDPDNSYPNGFSLVVSNGSNYSVSGTTITPSGSFTGNLNVSVRVNDGIDLSAPYTLRITVNPRNVVPTITGQVALSTNENKPITISLSHLTVNDPDNQYPNDFTLKLYAGSNYSFSGATVTPANNFTGQLTVPVTVNDGEAESEKFNLKISVIHVNVAPVITGQVALKTTEETPLTIVLSHLKVTDPDDKYPDNFTLKLFPGSNYTVSGNTIKPNTNFVGNIQVGVTVNDGEAESNNYKLQVQVTPINDPPVITGQVVLSVNEDTSVSLLLSHLTVTDPDNTYPNNFTLQVQPGTNYTVDKNVVTPKLNFNGVLTIGVTVSDGTSTSNLYSLKVTVNSILDPPYIVLEDQPGTYLLGKGSVLFSEKGEIHHPDGGSITYAEIGFTENNYRRGSDVLLFDNSKFPSLQGVFDSNRGVLFIIGTATPDLYTQAMRSIEYDYRDAEQNPLADSTKIIYAFVRDGESRSETKERTITMISTIKLNIPNSFTPNGDMANDTWRIRATNTADDYQDALIRVYNIRGTIVYESTGLEDEWDGNHNGSAVPSDTYYYTINLNLNYTRATYRGIVTILR